MAGGTIWKGIIHFGETDIPVKLHTAVREERIQFHLLHEPDQARVRQQLICTLEKRPVAAEEQSKGFEVGEGKYILLDPEELEQAVPESDRKIEVHEFVKTSQIDPYFLDRIYYPCLDRVNGRPWVRLVWAGSDGTGTIHQAQRIATGLRLKRVAEPVLVMTYAQTPEAILAPKMIGVEDLAREG